MNPTAPITAGTAGIGEITVNPDDIRGEGSHLQPTLVVPVSVKLNARPAEAAVVLLGLEARLATGQGPADRIGPPVKLDLCPGMRVTSVPWGSPDNGIDLHFPFTPGLIEHLERLRHTQDGNLGLRVSFTASAAWLRHSYNELGPNRPADTSTPFEPRYGIMADLTLFWTCQVQDLIFTVNQSTWVDKVLPHVGYDLVRLIEVMLPRDLDGKAQAAFGRQLRRLDRSGYEESVAASRALLHAWEQHLGATRQHTVAQVVAERQGWPADDPRARFFDRLWVAAKDMTNAAHHEARQDTPLELSQAETRAQMLLTALLSEWLSQVVDI